MDAARPGRRAPRRLRRGDVRRLEGLHEAAASPATSASAEPREQTTGRPAAIASTTVQAEALLEGSVAREPTRRP